MRLISALLASAFALGASAGQAQLLPAGDFAARDGRPGPGKHWRLTDAQGQSLAAAISAVAAQTPIVIDYDHQTIRAEKNGQPAPAAGWILSAEWRPGAGLFAKVDWTDAAKAQIDSRQYRYISPVIVSDEDTGQVTGLLLAALLNHPAILGMEPVVAQLATQFSINANHAQERIDMTLLQALIAALGISAEAKDGDVIAAVTALKAAPPKTALPVALAAELKLPAGAGETEALTAVRALKTPDTATLTMITALQGQIAELSGQLSGDKLTKLVDDAIAANKLVPAQKDWALNFGKKDFAALQGFIAGAPVIPGLNGQSKNEDRGGAGAVHALSDTQKLIATQLGIDPVKYAEQIKAQAQA